MHPDAKNTHSLGQRILDRIRENGAITFADFMEAALYDPVGGYYTSGRHHIGFAGDYFTSSTMSPAFGHTLARLVPLVDEALNRPGKFLIIELGAGKGLTAGQIIDALGKNHPELLDRVEYYCIERSTSAREGGTGTWSLPVRAGTDNARISLRRIRGTPPIEVENIDGIEPFYGLVFSNEFFDALPVHRVVMRDGGLREIMVTEREGKLAEIEAELSDPLVGEYFREEGVELSTGQQAEVCLAAKEYMDKIAAILHRGLVVTIDYGYPSYELYAPHRKRGTLMAYRRHKVVEDLYEHVGEQDLTAHVNFSSLVGWGRAAGIEPLAFTDQLRFFLDLGIHEVFAQMEAQSADYADYQVSVQAAKALIMPGGMGETFKVLVQYKGIDEGAVEALRSKISSKYSYG